MSEGMEKLPSLFYYNFAVPRQADAQAVGKKASDLDS
jgi:hypothetical protein